MSDNNNIDNDFNFLDGIEEFLSCKTKTVLEVTVSPTVPVPTPQPVGGIGFSVVDDRNGSIQKLNPTPEEIAKHRGSQQHTPQQVATYDAPPLYNRDLKQPAYTRKEEKPVHRAILELAAQGMTNVEIAARVGKTTQCVQDILRQPGAGELLVKRVTDNFGTDKQVVETIKANVISAVELVATVVRDTKEKTSVRLAAAEMLLNRRYGKATQPIASGTVVDLNNLPDEELAKMAQQN